ncbi:MAG: ubiquinone biosynthesis protein UbiA [Microbacterium sp. 14-71-5]|jgi:4-hydroxybenzoate polyprenyltransferase|nr:MAG: ubiquinone biosynthesis protein UbiA [Microbacterium sp. 14-71-5]
MTPDLFRASHPGPTVAVSALAGVLVVSAGGGARSALIVAAVLTGQLSIGWSNDWLDAARDTTVGRADKPVAAGRVTVGTVRAAALTAAALCVVLSLLLGWAPGAVHLVAVASAWSYNLLLKRTVWSWAPYALSFGLLPLVLALALPGRPTAAWWAVAAGALLGTGAHGLNVLPDLLDDAATGVRGLPHRLGPTATSLGSAAVLLVATVLLVTAPPGPVSSAGVVALAVATVVAVAGALVPLWDRHSRLPFVAAIVVAAVDVVLLAGSPWTVG